MSRDPDIPHVGPDSSTMDVGVSQKADQDDVAGDTSGRVDKPAVVRVLSAALGGVLGTLAISNYEAISDWTAWKKFGLIAGLMIAGYRLPQVILDRRSKPSSEGSTIARKNYEVEVKRRVRTTAVELFFLTALAATALLAVLLT